MKGWDGRTDWSYKGLFYYGPYKWVPTYLNIKRSDPLIYYTKGPYETMHTIAIQVRTGNVLYWEINNNYFYLLYTRL